MSNNDPAVRDSGRNDVQSAGDIFIGETMKPVAADTFRIEPLRYREMICKRAVFPVKNSIETGDLGKVREPTSNRADRSEVVRLVQRRWGAVVFEICENGIIAQDGLAERRAAVNHAVS